MSMKKFQRSLRESNARPPGLLNQLRHRSSWRFKSSGMLRKYPPNFRRSHYLNSQVRKIRENRRSWHSNWSKRRYILTCWLGFKIPEVLNSPLCSLWNRRITIFWVITQWVVAISYRHFWTACRWHIDPWIYVKTEIKFWSYLSQFYFERKMFQTKFVEKLERHILFCFQ